MFSSVKYVQLLTKVTLSSLWLDTNWIFRFLFPPLKIESTEVVTGTLETGVSSAATLSVRIKLLFYFVSLKRLK